MFSKKFLFITAFSLLSSINHTSFATAGQGRDNIERHQNKQEKRDDIRESKDDKKDLRALKEILDRFELSRAKRNIVTLKSVDNDISVFLNKEFIENKKEILEEKHEVSKGFQEIVGDQKEHVSNIGSHKPIAKAKDIKDSKDDRKDLEDDKRDLANERREQSLVHSIKKDWDMLYGRYDEASLQRKRAIILQLIDLSIEEKQDNRQERKEDKRERFEDKKERREAN